MSKVLRKNDEASSLTGDTEAPETEAPVRSSIGDQPDDRKSHGNSLRK